MRLWSLVFKSARARAGSSAALSLAAAVATAALVGALIVGDSVQATLEKDARLRIGRVGAVLQPGDRFFAADLAERVATTHEARTAASAIRSSGIASTPDGSARALDVSVLGVDSRFFALSPGGRETDPPRPGRAWLSPPLARQLGVGDGSSIIVRIPKPSTLPKEVALAEDDEDVLALRLVVDRELEDASFARFRLEASSRAPYLCVMDREYLAREIGQPGRANTLLVEAEGEPSVAVERLNAKLRELLAPDDLQLAIERRGGESWLVSSRVFLDPAIERAVQTRVPDATGILTYFVNRISHGDRFTPYSTVAAAGPIGVERRPRDPDSPPPIRIHSWLAEDLGCAKGDAIDLWYFTLARDLTLVEEAARFRVEEVVPMERWPADRDWMPDFPGLKDAQNCRDWEPGIPVDLDLIRDRDEAYWDDYGGTPKALIDLEEARARFGTPFGSLTAIRVPADREPSLRAAIESDLDVAALGFAFRDVATGARESARATTDFGGLFLGLSLFVIASALLLTALVFTLGAEQRAAEIGVLGAIGYPPRRILSLLLREGLVLAAAGAAAGSALAIAYTDAILFGLKFVWKDAVASMPVERAVRIPTLLGGAAASIATTVLAIGLAVRRLAKAPPADLLRARAGFIPRPVRRPSRGWWFLSAAGFAGAAALLVLARASAGPARAGAFFGAGAMLLVAGIALAWGVLSGRIAGSLSTTRFRLALGNATRRPGRSLATIAMLASGVFLVLSIGVNRLEAPSDATRRDSGTGGFTLFARTSVPILENLNTEEGLEAFGLDPAELAGARVVSLRRADGDEASCLSLARPRNPTLFGVDSQELSERRAFSFAEIIRPTADPWSLLREPDPEGAVPAIGDAASVTWSLHKKIGDTLEYQDERGETFRVRVVGAVKGSILQGMLLIDEAAFRARFPSRSGYRAFLIDADPRRADALRSVLSRTFADFGMEVVPAAERLARFNAVQNTYLAIFQVLGGLGVLLGTAGLFFVLLRNALERRSELAALAAIGYSPAAIRRLLRSEHLGLLVSGLAAGGIAALAAVVPAGSRVITAAPIWLALAIALSALFWVEIATRIATRGSLADALRAE